MDQLDKDAAATDNIPDETLPAKGEEIDDGSGVSTPEEETDPEE